MSCASCIQWSSVTCLFAHSTLQPLVTIIKDPWTTTVLSTVNSNTSHQVLMIHTWHCRSGLWISTISQMECLIHLVSTILILHLYNIGLGISIISKYSGTTYHYLYILLSYDFWHTSISCNYFLPGCQRNFQPSIILIEYYALSLN